MTETSHECLPKTARPGNARDIWEKHKIEIAKKKGFGRRDMTEEMQIQMFHVALREIDEHLANRRSKNTISKTKIQVFRKNSRFPMLACCG